MRRCGIKFWLIKMYVLSFVLYVVMWPDDFYFIMKDFYLLRSDFIMQISNENDDTTETDVLIKWHHHLTTY